MSRENVEVVRAVYDEWGRGNFRTAMDFYDPHVVLVSRPDMPDGGRYIGVDSLRAYMREFLEPLTNVTWTAEEFIETENSVVVATHQQATGHESGLPMEAFFFTVWTFRGRAVIRLEFFAERARALEAVGLRE